MARAARKAHQLDRVIFLPTGNPPHKSLELAPAEARLAMVRLAVEGYEGFEVSDLEVRRTETSYTYQTLEAFRRFEPEAELFFIIGADSLRDLPSWRRPERILALSRLITINRPGIEFRLDVSDLPSCPAELVARIEGDRVNMLPVDIASSDVREQLRLGRPADHLLPARVLRWVRQRGLFGTAGR